MKYILRLAPIILILGVVGCSNQTNRSVAAESQDWEHILNEQIKLLGHRNWIVVVDAAYPLQSSPGITMVLSDEDHLATIQKVMALIDEQPHIRPIVYVDKEIDFVEESAAPGITNFWSSLSGLLGSDPPQKLIHEDIIYKLSEASEQFSIFIIKTDFTIPYTSVFFQLDCKYWDAESEMILRKEIESAL